MYKLPSNCMLWITEEFKYHTVLSICCDDYVHFVNSVHYLLCVESREYATITYYITTYTQQFGYNIGRNKFHSL